MRSEARLLLGLSLLSSCGPAKRPASEIRITPLAIDLGEGITGQPVGFTLTVFNGGPQDLIVQRYALSCSCLKLTCQAKLPLSIKQGDSGHLRFSGHRQHGAKKGELVLFLGQGEQRKVLVEASTSNAYEFRPGIMVMRKVEGNYTGHVRVRRLPAHPEGEAPIVALRANAPLAWKLGDSDDEGWSQLKCEIPEGNMKTGVTYEANVPLSLGSHPLRLFTPGIADLVVDPPVLFLNATVGERAVLDLAAIRVSAASRGPIKPKSIQVSSSSGGQVEIDSERMLCYPVSDGSTLLMATLDVHVEGGVGKLPMFCLFGLK